MDPVEELDAAEEAAEQRKKKRERNDEEFKGLMREPRFRRFVWRLMSEGRVFHDATSLDALEMARQVGERRQGLKLLNEVLRLCPEQWINLIEDQKR